MHMHDQWSSEGAPTRSAARLQSGRPSVCLSARPFWPPMIERQDSTSGRTRSFEGCPQCASGLHGVF